MLLLEDKIKKVVDALDIPERFGIDNDCYYEDFYLGFLHDAVENVNGIGETVICNGASRAAIVLPEYGQAIKIPFSGAWYCEEWTEKDDCNDEWGEEDEFYPFEGADVNSLGFSDYCLTEVRRYEELKEKGLADFFAEIKIYREDIYPIYTQEYVLPLVDDDPDSRKVSKESMTKAENVPLCRLNKTWLASCFDYYGEEKTILFLEYIDNNITDLHGGNYGYRLDGSPAILDYADWRN